MLSRQFNRTRKLLQESVSKQSSLCSLSIIGTKYMSSFNPCTSSIRGNNNNNNNNVLLLSINRKWFSSSELTSDAILDRIKKVLGDMERAKVDESKPLTAESDIYKDVGLDSLDFVEFGIALEEEFKIEIDEDKAENITTVGDAINLIKENPQAV